MIRDEYKNKETGDWIYSEQMVSVPPFPDNELYQALHLVANHDWVWEMCDQSEQKFWQEWAEGMLDIIDKENKLERHE